VKGAQGLKGVLVEEEVEGSQGLKVSVLIEVEGAGAQRSQGLMGSWSQGLVGSCMVRMHGHP